MPVDRFWMRYARGAIGALALLALALSIVRLVDSRSRLVASAANEQLTDFTDWRRHGAFARWAGGRLHPRRRAIPEPGRST
jgi:hypothetical protein